MDKQIREDKYHQRFKTRLTDIIGLKEEVDFEQYVTRNPDFIFLNHAVLGEVKTKDNITSYRDAFVEIQHRNGKEYDIHNYDNFFVITEKYISFYKTSDFNWTNDVFDKADFDKFVVRFNNVDASIKPMWEYIQNNCQRIYVESDISNVLDMLLSEEHNLSVQDAFYILLHLNEEPPIYLAKDKKVVFYPNDEDKTYEIFNISKEDWEFINKHIIKKYKVGDVEAVKEYVRHNYSKHLSDTKKSNLGKYYTPKELVELIYDMVSPHINDTDIVMDLCCGCGAFMRTFDEFNLLGRDIDKNTIAVLELMGYRNVSADNSLVNVARSKYNLSNDDTCVIIGNPPYNDTTSKNKRFGTNAKTNTGTEIDADIKAKDLGHSFLMAYAKLNPSYICVLHPLSYLIKPSNFNQLKLLTENYKLIDGVIFPSSMFTDLIGSEFPVVAALYEQGTMDYDHIKEFEFKVLNSPKKFQLKKFTTIDDLPECSFVLNGKTVKNRFKYPRKIDATHIMKSDIDLYQYNIRDTNSLLSSGNLMALANNDNMHYCTVMWDELPYFAYLHNYKLFMKSNYLIGNLSPLCDMNDIHYEQFQDLMVIGTIVNETHRIPALDIDRKGSVLDKKFFINACKRKSKAFGTVPSAFPNFYDLFLDFVDNRANREQCKEDINNILIKYFEDLRNRFVH